MNIILCGPPGSGKGTQVSFISSLYKDRFLIVEMSKLLKNNNKHTDLIKSCIDEGRLVDDSIVMGIVLDYVGDVRSNMIFDGFPRTITQAELLKCHCEIDCVLLFKISDDVIMHRLSGRVICSDCGAVGNASFHGTQSFICEVCGSSSFYTRKDDLPPIIRDRLAIYHKEESFLFDFYCEKIVEINAEADISYISDQIRGVLD